MGLLQLLLGNQSAPTVVDDPEPCEACGDTGIVKAVQWHGGSYTEYCIYC